MEDSGGWRDVVNFMCKTLEDERQFVKCQQFGGIPITISEESVKGTVR